MTDEEIIDECHREIRRLRAVVRDLEDELNARRSRMKVEKAMTRDEAISTLQTIGLNLAVEFGLDEVAVGEDRQKGVWGEVMTEMLEKQHGKCTETIVWTDKNDNSRKVEFRFRFATPCLSIRMGEAFAEIEVSNYDSKTKKYDLPEFHISQTTVFNYDGGGAYLLGRLYEEWQMKTNRTDHLRRKAQSMLTAIMTMLPDEPRSADPNDDPGFWTDREHILCPSSEEAETVANFIEDIVSGYGSLIATTGYYDPEEDKKSNTVDKYTGFHYVDFS